MVTIEKIVLEIGGKKIELTLEEARSLMSILVDTFGDKTKIVEVERDRWYSYPYPYQVPYYYYPCWTITWCGTNTGTSQADGGVMQCSLTSNN